jgi:hypothetical protein
MSESQAILLLRLTLKGEAKGWYLARKFTAETLQDRLKELRLRYTAPNASFIALHELARIELKKDETLLQLLSRIERIARRGNIGEAGLIPTAIRALPRAIGIKICEMGTRGQTITWRTLYDFVRQMEPYYTRHGQEDLTNATINAVRKSQRIETGRPQRRTRWCKICRNEMHWKDQCNKILRMIRSVEACEELGKEDQLNKDS